MQKSFLFFSDNFEHQYNGEFVPNKIRVTIKLIPRHEDECDWEYLSFKDLTLDRDILRFEFSKEDWAQLDSVSQQIADENAHDAYRFRFAQE